MKKNIITLILGTSLFMFSCGGNERGSDTEGETNIENEGIVTDDNDLSIDTSNVNNDVTTAGTTAGVTTGTSGGTTAGLTSGGTTAANGVTTGHTTSGH